jgi:hypothetical protein
VLHIRLESIHNIFTLQTYAVQYNYRKISVLDACRDIMVYEPKHRSISNKKVGFKMVQLSQVSLYKDN